MNGSLRSGGSDSLPSCCVCLDKARLIRRWKSDPANSRSGRKRKERSRR